MRLLLPALLLSSALASAQPALSPRQQAEDFDAAWRAIDQGYAYFDAGRGAWRKAREAWRPRAERARTRDEFVAALEGALAALRDDHVSLSERSRASPRRVPMDTDIWAGWRRGQAVVEAVRTFGDADVAGLRPGLTVLRIDGVPVAKASERWLASRAGAGAQDRDWALRRALAGPRAGPVRIEASGEGGTRVFDIVRADTAPAHGPAFTARRVGEQRDLGYLRLRNGFSDPALAGQFAGAMSHFKDTRGLILDLRDVTGQGARRVTEAILGHFVTAPTPWQLRGEGAAKRADSVSPNGEPPYRAPVVVLVDRWTAGEGEALAAGLAAVARARLLGTPMAGLRGELREVALPHSGIVLRFPGERTYHVDGTPREKLRPHVAVDLAAPSGGPGDPILYQALKLFEH